MRQFYFMLIGLTLLVSCTPENRVIENPVYTARNNNSIEVSRVTLTDSTTVLDIQATYTPNYWIKVASTSQLIDNKGNTYPISSSIGIEPDKEFWMPESGEATFQLVFPPLKRGAKSIDFTEGPEVNGGWKIWDIQLKSKELPKLNLPKELLTQQTDKEAALPQPTSAYGEATLKGHLLDYKPGMEGQGIQTWAILPVGSPRNEEIIVDEKGNFEVTFQVTGSVPAMLYVQGLQGQGIPYFLEPGETTEIYVNMREMNRRQSGLHKEKAPYGEMTYVKGPLASLLQELTEIEAIKKPIFNAHQQQQKEVGSMEEYRQLVINTTNKVIEAVEQSSLSKSAKEYVKITTQIEGLYELYTAPNLVTHLKLHQAKKEVSNEERQKLIANEKKAMNADYFPNEWKETLKDPKATYTPYLNNIVTTLSWASPAEKESMGLNMKELETYMEISKIAKEVSDFKPLTDEQRATMKGLPEAYSEYLEALNKKVLAQIEANKKKEGFTVNEAGEVSNEDLFASIISKYRGKTLLVDFWATWCGPCRMANKEMKPMKEELKEKDIVYLYITGETSPKETWEQMIPDIKGEHFRVTAAQWEFLCNTFGIEGVPTYFVIDREGTIKYKSVGFPGVSKMKEELQKAL